MDVPSGDLILAVAVLGIVVTAPIGSILIKAAFRGLLEPPPAEGLRKELFLIMITTALIEIALASR